MISRVASALEEHAFATVTQGPSARSACATVSARFSTMFPEAGGQYVFLREAYGPLAGFLFGWTSFFVIASGGIAALAAGKGPGVVPGLVWRQRDGQFLQSPGVPIEVDLHRLPLPRRDLVLRYRPEYFFLYFQPDSSVATGRGCPYRCNFCSVWEFYRGKTRQMSPLRVTFSVPSFSRVA